MIVFEIGEQSGQVARFFNYRPGCFFDLNTEFIGNDAAQGCFTQARRTMKKYMVQGFSSLFGGFNKYQQIFNKLWLTRKFADHRWPDAILKFFVSGSGRYIVSLQVWICHK